MLLVTDVLHDAKARECLMLELYWCIWRTVYILNARLIVSLTTYTQLEELASTTASDTMAQPLLSLTLRLFLHQDKSHSAIF